MQSEYEVNGVAKVLSFDGTDKAAAGHAQNIPYWDDVSPWAEAAKQRALAKASPEAIRFWKKSIEKPPMRFDASGLTEAQWQARRKDSIGSSAASHVTGDCPFQGCTPFDLYNEKIGNKPLFVMSDEEARQREDLLDFGHAMEPYLRKWLQRHCPNSRLLVDTNIYTDSERPYLTANLDGMLQLSDGSWIHIEFKTANKKARQAYDNESIPLYYRRQLVHCQHILNVWTSRIVVMFDRDDILIREYERDLDFEMEQILEMEDFWENHVIPHIPPALNRGPAANVLKAVRNYAGPANASADPIQLPRDTFDNVAEVAAINKELTDLNARQKALETLRSQKISEVVQDMNNETSAVVSNGSTTYQISYKPQKARTTVDLEVLKNDFPLVYQKVAHTPAEGPRPFRVKELTSKAKDA